VFFIEHDHLNTPRAIKNQNNTVVWQWNSDPYGKAAPSEDPDSDGVKFEYNLRFPGQVFDKETGLNYNWRRNYDPGTGRYIESDPMGISEHVQRWRKNVGAPNQASLEINSYAYALENPLRFVDPKGLESPTYLFPPPAPPRSPSELPFDPNYASCAQYPSSSCEGKALHGLCGTFGADPNSNCARKCLQVSLPPGRGDDPPLSWYVPQHPICWYECGWPGGWR